MNTKLYFTKAGFEKLRREIDRLTLRLNELQAQTAYVAEVGGDQYHDNSSYDLLVIDIRGIDHRLSSLYEAMNHAVVIDWPHNAHVVRIGTEVTIIDLESNQESIWEIAGYGESDPDNYLLAYNTPLGELIMGRKKDDLFEGLIGGKRSRMKILNIGLGGHSELKQ